MNPAMAPRRLHIAKLELDLRGIEPGVAEAAVRALGPALGPALAHALAQGAGPLASAERIDAGRITSSASPSAHTLAAGMAQGIASSLGGNPK